MPTHSVRRAAFAAAAASLVAVTPLACAQSAHAADYPPGPGNFNVSTSLVIAGGHLTFTAVLPSGQQIVVSLALPFQPALGTRASRGETRRASVVQPLATYTADAKGNVAGQVMIPADTAPGMHLLTLTAKGSNKSLSVPIRVSLPRNEADAPRLAASTISYNKPLTRSDASFPVAQAVAATGMVACGTVAVALLRRRRDQD